MLKCALKVALFPMLLLTRLLLCVTAFVTSIAGTVSGLSVSLFAMLSVIEFIIGAWQNGLAFAALAILVGPIGLPGVANLILEGIHHVLGFLEKLLT